MSDNMPDIISISVNEDIRRELDDLQKSMGFSGRSEAIRAAVRVMAAEQKDRAKLKGECDAVLLVIHKDEGGDEVSEIRHEFSGIIKTQVHNHLKNHKCLEIFVLGGDASKVRKMTELLQSAKSVELAKLILS